MTMAPIDFKWALHWLRRRAENGEDDLWDVVLDGEALLEGQPTKMTRNEVFAAVIKNDERPRC